MIRVDIKHLRCLRVVLIEHVFLSANLLERLLCCVVLNVEVGGLLANRELLSMAGPIESCRSVYFSCLLQFERRPRRVEAIDIPEIVQVFSECLSSLALLCC